MESRSPPSKRPACQTHTGFQSAPVGRSFVTRPVPDAAEGCDFEHGTIPTIAERVENEGHVLVSWDVAAVATHFVQDPPLLGLRVPAAYRHVHVVPVIRDPHVGLLCRRLVWVRLHLVEIAHRRYFLVERLVQPAVHAQTFRYMDRLNEPGDPARHS